MRGSRRARGIARDTSDPEREPGKARAARWLHNAQGEARVVLFREPITIQI